MTQTTTPSQDVQEMVAQADTGARAPKGLPRACALVCSALLVTFPTLVRFTTPLYLRLRRTQ